MTDILVRVKKSKSMISKNTSKVHSDEAKSKIAAAEVFKSLNSKRVSCKYCGKEGNLGNIERYHNDKCKTINSLSTTG